jgi:hypothetical protein
MKTPEEISIAIGEKSKEILLSGSTYKLGLITDAIISLCLEANDYSVELTSIQLGVSRPTVYTVMKRLGIKIKTTRKLTTTRIRIT